MNKIYKTLKNFNNNIFYSNVFKSLNTKKTAVNWRQEEKEWRKSWKHFQTKPTIFVIITHIKNKVYRLLSESRIEAQNNYCQNQ